MDKRIFWAGLAALASLSGCAENRERLNEEDLNRMAHWLPGTYNNTQQARDDIQKGVQPPHDAVELAIVPIESVAVGRYAYYVQEMAADDPNRVLSQKVILFHATDKGILESVATLGEPLRWRNGQRDADMFLGMTPKDFSVLSGCELTWKREESADAQKPANKEEAKKAAEHARFIGINESKHCEATSHRVMGLVQVELRGELSSKELSTAELQYDSDGKLISGNAAQPFYRFRKIGN